MKNIKDIVFPSEKTKIQISEILKKYSLYETGSEMMEKIRTGKISATTTFTFIVKKVAIGEITLSEAIAKLKTDLVLPLETAQQIINELNEKVIPLGKERAIFEKEKKREIERAEVQKEPLPTKEKIVNPYREPVE